MKHLKIALFLGLLGMIAGAFVFPYQLDALKISLGEAEYTKMIDQIPVSMTVVAIVTVLQIAVLTTVLSWIGLKLTTRTGLILPLITPWILEKKKPVIDQSGLKLAVVGGIVGAIFMIGADVLLFQPYIPKLGNGESVVWWKALLGGALYGGIVEEVLIRLFLMTLIVWILAVLFKKKKGELPNAFFWIGLIIAALLFSAGHLPATAKLYDGLTPILITRAFVLNGVLGCLFGYIYWKKGLEYAMISHMCVHVVNQLILIPLLSLL
ncbi:CPBP family intramembrane glutamic endopeptidase [Bacillus sp. NEB1478]|uniref:CPBP family intramembrane glutamic endopeptidase n=1 Tax=Bacillus sp. NEB1478 TaxID=3073816 RepID=UPI002873124C|nr:CPBP family intramembrane glutamic endopeptidase [Bacillus sp. NEB1478]WNB91792.1 CPBP family intramembrane glutamic endopeptidase [Bacillus sp. NEB1478]